MLLPILRTNMVIRILTSSYQFCDNCFIYPITPSTPMATNADAYASRGVKNVFGQVGYVPSIVLFNFQCIENDV